MNDAVTAPASELAPHTDAPLGGRRRIAALAAVAACCAIIAIVARLLVVRSWGGLHGVGNYDDAVYYTGAAALVHGRVLYRDLLFLQPPGIALALAPFAALGRLIGDSNAWALARFAFVLVGAANTALVALVLRRFGLPAAAIGGLFYAVSYPAMYSERSTLLEPLGGLGVLAALALLSFDPGLDRLRRSRLLRTLAGVALGLGIAVKVFYLLPALVIAAFLWRRSGPLLLGLVGSLTAVLLPFFALAPAAMWRQVVLDQLGRPRIAKSLLGRLKAILEPPTVPGIPHAVVLWVLILLAVVLVVLALRDSRTRLFATLLVTSTALLLVTPSYYRHYAVLAVLPLALVVGAVVGPLVTPRSGRLGVRAVLPSGVALLVVLAIGVGGWAGTGLRGHRGTAVPRGLTAAIRAVSGCVTTLTPSSLIRTDTLTLMLDRGCAVRADVTGAVYDGALLTRNGVAVRPARNARWQRNVLAYLRSGDAVLLSGGRVWLSDATNAEVRSGRLLFNVDGYRLYAINR